MPNTTSGQVWRCLEETSHFILTPLSPYSLKLEVEYLHTVHDPGLSYMCKIPATNNMSIQDYASNK